MKRLTFILSLFIYSQSFASEQMFEQGNKQYTNENYSAAISLYDSILTSGSESSELYYNLGNCHYKTNDWANAIWHYEKSLQLNNNNKTIHNLELSKLKIIDRIEPLPQLFYKKWWSNLTQTLSTQVWQTLVLSVMSFIFILQLISQFTSLKSKIITRIFSVITVITLLLTQNSYHNNFTKREAIIFSETITVNSAPTSNSTNLFTLHAGSKVEIIDSIGDWINFKIANGNSGWIPENSIKEL
jgi:tetratricopeptide (TPR) repeat protein|tara:strand:+ start:35 stop:763 length:729 start_codon:yes stop_codon:yes gene_type:complete